MKNLSIAAKSLLGCAILLLAACSMSTVTTILTTITAAAEVAVPIIAQAGGLSPVVTTEIMDYLHSVSTAVTETTVELQSADTPVVRAEKIGAIWAGVVLNPAILQSLPPNIRGIVQSVAVAVQNFLTHFGKARASTSPTSPPSPPLDFTTSRKDRSDLAKLAQRSTAVSVAVDQWRHK